MLEPDNALAAASLPGERTAKHPQDSGEMSRKANLRVRALNHRFGGGCPHCVDANGNTIAEHLEKNYCPVCRTVHALRNIDLEVYPGEILGVVGESGSGKSTLMQSLYFDREPSAGEYYLDDFDGGQQNLFSASGQTKRKIRNFYVGKVYQNPVFGLRMNFSAMANVAENLIAGGKRNIGAMNERASSLLEYVNIPSHRSAEAPKKFSGGMQQRVQIAKALSNNPPILLLDEVTTGLDLSVQAKVLDLIKRIQSERQISMILVSHDLGVIRMLANRTVVMLSGQIIERGLSDQIMEDPQHPYTQELVQSLL